MTQTKIFTTRKLEKAAKKIISENNIPDNELLGNWNATLFHVSHKKCWLVINKTTLYQLILPDIKNADLENLTKIFKETFYAQLKYDGIKTEYELVDKIIGEITLHKTNNDRSLNSFLNNSLLNFRHWKYQFGDFENMPFRELNRRLNNLPIKSIKWIRPKEKMAEMIKIFQQQE